MAVQMDKPSDISSRERAQRLYSKNVELENTRRKSAHSRVPYDPNVWQQIRENYEAIILEDNSFSEQHEIELALWQLHYQRIEELRVLLNAALSSNTSTVQNGKGGPARPDRLAKIRAQFKTFLSEATGFYHELMVKVRSKYGLPLGYFSEDPENQLFLSRDGLKTSEMKKGLISCHRCLIYLGDLGRYKGLYGDGESKTRDFVAASSYYLQASSLWPSSGNPHHQLAIVAGYRGDEFVGIYRYFRSLAVESPFSTARDNLIIAFERNRQNFSQLLGDSKAACVKTINPRMNGKGRGRGEAKSWSKDHRSQSSPSKESTLSNSERLKAFSVKFVRVNGILFTRTSLETFADVLSMVKNDFVSLLSSGSEEHYNFGLDAAECGLFIVRLVAILIFTVHNVLRESENQSYAEILQRSVLLQNSYTAMFELMGHVVERCVQLHDLLSSYLLPGILVFVEWLACHPDVAKGSEPGEKEAIVRFFFWDSCISLFNKLLLSGFMSNDEDESCFFNLDKYEEGETGNRIALWEDFELRGFLPLHPAQQILDFSRKHSFGTDGRMNEKRTRAQRIVAAGKTFSSTVQLGEQGIYFDPNMKKFMLGAEPHLSIDFTLNCGPEVLDGMGQGLSVDTNSTLGVLEPGAQMVEAEDEEEVIVFKPSVADKQPDTKFSTLTSYEDLGLVSSVADTGAYVRSVSAIPNGYNLQNGFDTSSRSSTPVASFASQHVQPVQLNTSVWLEEQQKTSLVNGFKNCSLMENNHSMKQKPSEHFTTLQSAALSLPFSHSFNVNAGNGYPMQEIEAVMPAKIDFNLSSATDLNICPVKTQSIPPVGSKKNPVSRPNRRAGPPPGFTPTAPKCADDVQGWSSLKDDVPIMDDYGWLDGYQAPFSNKKDNGFNCGSNFSGALYNKSENNGVPGVVSFPFPGKQAKATTFQVPADNHKLWQDYQFPDVKRYEQQQSNGIQQQISMPQRFQGQSLWDGRFVV